MTSADMCELLFTMCVESQTRLIWKKSTKISTGSEAEMRNALRFAREKGMEKLQVYKEASLCDLCCVFHRFSCGFLEMAMTSMTWLQEISKLSTCS